MREDNIVNGSAPENGRRFKLDPNVRIGDVLVILALLGSATAGYFNLAGRVERNEVVQKERDAAQDQVVTELRTNLRDSISQIRSDQADIRTDVREIARVIRGR